MDVLIIILLLICTVSDLHDKTIPAIPVWVAVGIMFIYRIYLLVMEKCSIRESIWCFIPGLLLLMISHMGNQIGSGDGWMIIVMGLYLGWEKLLAVIFYAFLAAGSFAAGYIVIGCRDKKERLPFIPFLFLGTVIIVGRKV